MSDINFTPFPNLETEHFYLRPLTSDDENEIFALRSNDEINKYLSRAKAHSIEDVRQFIARIAEGLAKNESILWVISMKHSLQFTGTICLWNISVENASAEIGYELLPQFHGKGIMQEVIPVVIGYGFQKMKLQAILAELSPLNLKSVKLLERNGFALLRKHDDSAIYELKSSKFTAKTPGR